MIVPTWFKKELRLIDRTYKCEDPDDHKGYFIVKDIDLTIRADDGRSLSIPGGNLKNLRIRGPLIILWVPELSSQALEELRKMKADGLAMGIYENPLKELAFYQTKKREARKKRAAAVVDIITEGIMEADRMSKKKSWSYGGEKQLDKGVPNGPKVPN
jgi:hypothetical protein